MKLQTHWEALVGHVSCGSGSCLSVGRALCCHASYGPLWAAGLKHKKSLAGLPVQLDPRVPNKRTHVFKAPDVRAIMALQDV
jgi:hypothetical protein